MESTEGESHGIDRLDPAYEWLPWPGPRDPIDLVLVRDDPCKGGWGPEIAGRAALVIQSEGPAASGAADCSYAQIIKHAQVSLSAR